LRETGHLEFARAGIGGKVTFKFLDAFETEIDPLDDEHRSLVATINAIAEIEERADAAALEAALSAFLAELAAHFRGEEAHLQAAGSPYLAAHALHHADIVAALERLIAEVRNGTPVAGGVAHVCYHQLVSAVLRMDMDFVNWLADRRGTRRSRE